MIFEVPRKYFLPTIDSMEEESKLKNENYKLILKRHNYNEFQNQYHEKITAKNNSISTTYKYIRCTN